MSDKTEAEPPQPSEVSKILNHRRAVKLLAKSLVELAETGNINARSLRLIKEFTHGKA